MPTRHKGNTRSLAVATFASLIPSKASLSSLFDSEQVPVGALCSFTILWERRERQRVSKRKREKETARNTIGYQSCPVHSQQSFDSGQGGVWVRKTAGRTAR